MKQQIALCIMATCTVICMFILAVFLWPRDKKVEPNQNVSNALESEVPEVDEELPAPQPTPNPTDDDEKFTQALNNPSNPPDIIESPSDWDGWKHVVPVESFNEVDVPSETVSFLCDVSGFNYPEDAEPIRNYIATIGNTLGIDISLAEAGDPSGFPSVVRGSIPVHLTVDGVTYYSFVKDNTVYIFGAIEAER